MSSAPRKTRTTLTRDRVLDEAWELIRAEGTDGLSMRALSQRLGVVPMALYRHVHDKDDLLDGLLDRLTARVPIPGPRVAPRTAIERVARGIRDEVVDNPALVPALVLRPSLGPSAYRMGERVLGAFVQLGLTVDDATRAWNAVSIYALGFGVFAAPRRVDGGFPGGLGAFAERVTPEVDTLAGTTEVDRTEWVSDAQFDLGLRALVDGLLTGR
jgi:AcrR family transcriptional regulator